ncbi:hypothetical protein [Vannielia litorea]|uniref:hypothetical protein n=1 Tax=Vannielia litorea TaxID=1217970 RepID=UPI001BCC725D|nr:hypothetical protein [Vannielia litorea]MBS8229083.1 hypothetical protein [Vannielia litorea]
MPLPRDYAISLLLGRPVPVRGSTVIEVTRDGAGWTAWLVDMDVPENTRALGPFRGRREARRTAKAALDGVEPCPASKPVLAQKRRAGYVRDPRLLFDAVGPGRSHVRLRGV